MPKPTNQEPKVPSWRKPPVEFTDERAETFLREYRDSGVFYASAAVAGVESTTVRNRMKADPAYAALVAEAKEEHTDELVQQAIKLALHGTKRPIVGGKNKDEIITYETMYSERMLELLLKTRREEFRCRDKVEDEGQKGGVMVVPARQTTMDDWEKEHGEAAKGQTGKPAGVK